MPDRLTSRRVSPKLRTDRYQQHFRDPPAVARTPITNAVTSDFSQKYDLRRQSGFSRAGHMVYCTRTAEIFSVRSSAAPGSVERARQRSKMRAAVPIGDLRSSGKRVTAVTGRRMELLYELH
jgi:hypothetical protein